MSEGAPYDWHNALDYLEGLLPDDVRQLERGCKSGPVVPAEPTIGPSVAQLVAVLVLATRPARVLEIGTAAGYSAIAIGRALKHVGGRLTTVEIDADLAQAARKNVADAGLADTVEVVNENANETIGKSSKAYGLILQDGSKDDYLQMLPRLVDLLEPHGLLITDDVLFPVMDLPASVKRWQQTMRVYNRALQTSPELATVWLPIGDGVAVSVKVAGDDDEKRDKSG
jgi:predicted O-methyltransferase YrrM